MTMAIRATKLHIPPRLARSVLRPRLVEQLNEGLHRKLTLISAPAGFGKTTVVREWVAGCGRPVAWLTLDERDNDPARFLAYLVAALRTVAPEAGAGALRLLQSSRSPPTESILTALLNGITASQDTPVLVLDDYHLIDSEPVDAVLAALLEQLPAQLHLVITTREDPRLPLARLRASGQLTELRTAHLRFTVSEAAEFLNGTMGLDLSEDDAARLEARTEGWIAGLQLAALSLRGREDVASFIASFTGSHRFVLDYLVEEVLQRQPDPIRSFLLRTCILDRLTGPLCDAVTGEVDGGAMLARLERGNLFVVPLDDHRRWYRYHHLFAAVLQTFAPTEQGDERETLHRRASVWHERHGSASDAIRHALAARDFERAAGLIELATPDMRRTRRGATLLGWIKALPDEIVRRRPVLSVSFAATLLDGGQLEAVEAHLRDAERWLERTAEASERSAAAAAGMAVVDEEAFRQLPGSIAMHRAGLAQVSGDAAGTARYARQALELASEEDHFGRGGALALLGLASWASGELETAHRTFSQGMARLRMAGFVADAIGGTIALADIRAAQGRLREASEEIAEALRQSGELGGLDPRGALGLHVGMSELLRERNELDAAARHLRTAKELGERAGWAQSRSRWCAAMARVAEAGGDPGGALDLLHEAERRYVPDYFPNVRPIAAAKARTWVAQGRLGEALTWARELGPSHQDELGYLREFEHITLARVLLARFKRDRDEPRLREATNLLDRLLRAAEAGGRAGSTIEILTLQALAHKAQGNATLAFGPLERALTLAEPEGYVRIFVDEGASMAELLRRIEGQLVTRALKRYCRALLGHFAGPGARPVGTAQEESPPRRGLAVSEAAWAEPLSARELEVLRLIAAGLSNRAIAQRLFRAESTIKGQNRIIFDKLQVESRTEAIARARELGLL